MSRYKNLNASTKYGLAGRTQGYDERLVFNVDKSFDWDSINQATGNLSLFSNRRIIELRMVSPKPGKEGGRVLSEYADQLSEDNLLIISSEKMDKSVQNTKWFKARRKSRRCNTSLAYKPGAAYPAGYNHVYRPDKND